MYDPNLGRFTQTDPILGNRPSQHDTYANNKPSGKKDPRGLAPNDIARYWIDEGGGGPSNDGRTSFVPPVDLQDVVNGAIPLGKHALTCRPLPAGYFSTP